MKLVYGSNSMENLIDTAVDVLIVIHQEEDCYEAAKMLQASKVFWEELDFYRARKWITESDMTRLWERYEARLDGYIKEWDEPIDD